MGQQTDWPELRSGLTAPEWLVLNYAGHSEGRESFKVAVKELVARGVLQVEPIEARTWHRSRTLLSALVEGPRFGTTPAPPLAPVLDVFAGATKRTLQAAEESARGRRPIEGVSTERFARAARRHFRWQLNRYRDRHVLPALVERGLMTAERGPLGTRKGWTDAGRQAVDDLDAWSEVGRTRMGQWLAEDPAKALAYAASAGAAVLLMDDLLPAFEHLARDLVERRAALAGDGGGPVVDPVSGSSIGGGADPSETGVDLSGTDLGGLDLASLGTDLGGFDSLDAAFGALDLGIDAGGFAGGGGGGDGGG